MTSIYPNTIVMVQPGGYKDNPFQGSDGWNSGLCNCCENVGQCVYAYFCWPCFMCSLAKDINESQCSSFCIPNALAMYRMKVRTAYRIQGDTCNDHCTVAFCGFCAGMQLRNELRYRGIS